MLFFGLGPVYSKKGENMVKTRLLIGALLLLFMVIPSQVFSDSNYKYAPKIDQETYFGHISYVDIQNDGKDPVVFEEGQLEPDIAILNYPIAPGDTIRTSAVRRCEIQFDTGTIIRLDYDTEIKVESILALSLSARKKITNLLLNRGRIYIQYKRYNRPEIFQIKTPNTAVRFDHKAVAFIYAKQDEESDIQVNEGQVFVLYGADWEHLDSHKVKKNRRVTVNPKHELLERKEKQNVEFELWNQSMNDAFLEMHEGRSQLPKPIMRYTPAVINFAQKYSNRYGEWIWYGMYGYVWRSYYNNFYPWGNWSPYIYGQWRSVNGEMFWIPQEPWGWVPYHLGLWTWDKDQGWLWIPGSAFAPAWVTWRFFYGGSYCSWYPMHLLDWYSGSFMGGAYWGNDPYYYGGNSNVITDESSDKRVLTRINKDQLQRKGTPNYKLPKDLKKTYKNLVKALERGDQKLLASIREMPRDHIVVKRDDLNTSRFNEKRVSGSADFISEKPGELSHMAGPEKVAAQIYKENRIKSGVRAAAAFTSPAELPDINHKTRFFNEAETSHNGANRTTRRTRTSRMDSKPKARMHPVMRFHDWNPDVHAARVQGVTIQYDSRRNEVCCPELGLRSWDVGLSNKRARVSRSSGGFTSGGGSAGGPSSLSSSSSRGSISSSAKASSGSARGSSGRSSSSGKKK